jgi:O-antigen/teichoic acid export membrane protein
MHSSPDRVGIPISGLSRPIDLITAKVSIKYVAMAIDYGLAIFMVPFNLAHLGRPVYGLWMLAAAIPAYLSLLDLGYSAALVKFAAQYRASGDSRVLNEIASTFFVFFSVIGLSAYVIAAIIAFNLQALLNLNAEQATLGRRVLLIISIYIAAGFPCSVFGAIVRGFMDPYMTSVISIATSLLVVAVNVALLLAGYGLLPLIAAITAIRTLSFWAYWKNARRVFPPLQIRLRSFRFGRIRELTGFGMALLLIDLANKLNYSTDALVIGAYMSTAAVAGWTIAQRPIDLVQRFSNELNQAVFPVVVDSATLGHDQRLRTIFLYGTQLSLAIVIGLAIALALMARPVIALWVGPEFGDSAPVVYVLALVVMMRLGGAAATTLLVGAGRHRLLAITTITAGAANLLLSVLLVRKLGLIGVALGTLIPLSVVSVLVIFPTACRRIGLSVRSAVAAAVAPALWPALPAMALALGVRALTGNGLLPAASQAVIAVLSYGGIFFGLALGDRERDWYLDNFKHLVRRSSLRAAS